MTSTNPSYAHRGDTNLTVHVFGTGFAAGANARWSIGTDTTSVTTESTSFVSATEVVAVISVSGTAPIALYNVSVTKRDGKKGVGAELFAVTTAVVVGSGTLGGDVIVNEMNDLGQVVGYFDAAGPFVSNGNMIVSLGTTGQSWGISPSGDVVVGRDNSRRMIGRVSIDSKNFAWRMWDTPSSFTTLTAPSLQTVNSAGTVVIGVLPNGGPALWYRSVSTGLWNPTAIALPTGGGGDGSAQDVNDDGVIVGYACGKAAVWRVDASVSRPTIVSGPLFLVGLGGNGTNSGSRADAVTSTSPYVVAGSATSGGHRLLVKWTVQ